MLEKHFYKYASGWVKLGADDTRSFFKLPVWKVKLIVFRLVFASYSCHEKFSKIVFLTLLPLLNKCTSFADKHVAMKMLCSIARSVFRSWGGRSKYGLLR